MVGAVRGGGRVLEGQAVERGGGGRKGQVVVWEGGGGVV